MKRRAAADDAAPRRSARNDPAQRARVARERAAAQDRRERDALDKALEAEAKRIRRLPEVAFDAAGAAASPEGLARWRLAAADVEALRGAQDAIAAQIDKMPWAGGSDDGDKRWRGYGLPPARGGGSAPGWAIDFIPSRRRLELRAAEAERNWRSCADFAADRGRRRCRAALRRKGVDGAARSCQRARPREPSGAPAERARGEPAPAAAPGLAAARRLWRCDRDGGRARRRDRGPRKSIR